MYMHLCFFYSKKYLLSRSATKFPSFEDCHPRWIFRVSTTFNFSFTKIFRQFSILFQPKFSRNFQAKFREFLPMNFQGIFRQIFRKNDPEILRKFRGKFSRIFQAKFSRIFQVKNVRKNTNKKRANKKRRGE